MLWTLSLMLVVLWLLAVVTGYTLGGAVHVLPVAAVAAAILGGLARSSRHHPTPMRRLR